MFIVDDLSPVSLAEFMSVQNWQAQYRLLTQWGKLIQPKPELRVAEYLLKGCEVSAWLEHVNKNGINYFAFDSDSRVINGLAVLLLAQVNGKTTEEINAVDFYKILQSAGLEKHLTPSRNNGLRAIIARVESLMNESPSGLELL